MTAQALRRRAQAAVQWPESSCPQHCCSCSAGWRDLCCGCCHHHSRRDSRLADQAAGAAAAAASASAWTAALAVAALPSCRRRRQRRCVCCGCRSRAADLAIASRARRSIRFRVRFPVEAARVRVVGARRCTGPSADAPRVRTDRGSYTCVLVSVSCHLVPLSHETLRARTAGRETGTNGREMADLQRALKFVIIQ